MNNRSTTPSSRHGAAESEAAKLVEELRTPTSEAFNHSLKSGHPRSHASVTGKRCIPTGASSINRSRRAPQHVNVGQGAPLTEYAGNQPRRTLRASIARALRCISCTPSPVVVSIARPSTSAGHRCSTSNGHTWRWATQVRQSRHRQYEHRNDLFVEGGRWSQHVVDQERSTTCPTRFPANLLFDLSGSRHASATHTTYFAALRVRLCNHDVHSASVNSTTWAPTPSPSIRCNTLTGLKNSGFGRG